jgi:hypothetical protein
MVDQPDIPLEERLKFNELISLQEASQATGLTIGHLGHLIRSGTIWGKKLGRNWVTTRQAIQDYLASNPKPGRKSAKKP